eukprot:EG_transcript_5457
MWLLALFLLGLAAPSLTANQTDGYCYITVSDGTEYCYYYPSTGYQCVYGTAQDPTHRNLSACNYMGVCYVVVGGGEEVCYYSTPYGYDCYYEPLPQYLANMSSCDNLKANSPPEITFALGNTREMLEGAELWVSDLSVTDVDARESEADGRGFMLVTLTATNGFVKLDPNATNLTAQQEADAWFVLNNAKEYGGVDWAMGAPATYATQLSFQARMDPLLKVLKAVVLQPTQYFNTQYNGGATLSLVVYVNDQGNTGGAAESDTKTLAVTVIAVNNPPIITAPNQTAVNEDTLMTFTGISVWDPDVNERQPSTLNVTLSVMKGTLYVATVIPKTIVVGPNNQYTLSMTNTMALLNSALATLTYMPAADENDDTGVDQLTIVVDDMGHWGLSYGPADRIATAVVPLHVIPVNDHPVLFAPPFFYTDEDTALYGLNMTVSDVDTFDGITVRIAVLNGTLAIPSLGLAPNRSLTFTDNLRNLTAFLSRAVYMPDRYFNGVDQLIVDITDNQPFNSTMPTRYVPILVEAINNPPVITFSCPSACAGGNYTATPGSPVVALGATYTFTGADNTHPRVVIVDVDAGSGLVQILLSVSKGNFRLGNATGLKFTYPVVYNASNPPDLILAMGTLTTINAALNQTVYTRTAAGEEDMIIAVNDMGNTGRGGPGTDVSIFTLY